MGLMKAIKKKAGEYKSNRELNIASRKEISRKARIAYWKAREKEAIKVAKEKGRKASRPRTERVSKRLQRLASGTRKAYRHYEKTSRSFKMSAFKPTSRAYSMPIKKRKRKRVIVYY